MGGQRHSTRFADMGEGSLRGWILWANSHDWGQGPNAPAYYDETTGELVTHGGENDGFTYTVTEARHKTPAELKAWAGY